jgi:type II secretory pathway component GspD/PulD (secretin)
MNTLLISSARPRVPAKRIVKAVATALLLTLAATGATQAPSQENPREPRQESVEVFHLAHAMQANDLNDLLQVVRNIIGVRAKAYPDSTQSAIIVRGTSDEIEQARKLVAELDKPVPLYKLTFTITELEDGKPTGSQRYTLLAAESQKVELKEGHRVPLITGKIGTDANAPETQVSYVDIGLNISATLEGSGLRSKIEQSAVADEKSNVNIQDPLIRQVSLTNTTIITLGKPAMLCSIGIPNSTRHKDVEVLVERVP